MFRTRGLLGAVIGLMISAPLQAQDEAFTLPTFDCSANIIGGLRIRPAECKPDQIRDWLGRQDPEVALHIDRPLVMLTKVRRMLLSMDVQEVACLFTLSGLPSDPVVFALPASEDATADVLVSALSKFSARQWESKRYQNIMLLGSQENLERLTVEVLDPHRTFARAFAEHQNSALQWVVAPSMFHRRAVRELLPSLPAELGGGPSATLIDGVQWLSFSFKSENGGTFDLAIQSIDSQAATALKSWFEKNANALLMKAIGDHVSLSEEQLQTITPSVKAEGLRWHGQLGAPELSQVLKVFMPAVTSIVGNALSSQIQRRMKELVLSLHNFHDSNERFPGYGTSDADGRSLLSWRVQVLPWLGHNELYEQFHLDEPWNSDHNKQLIEKMPSVFAAVGSELPLKSGLTNFRVPGGSNSMFPDREGISFGDISDGSSNTIAIFEVDDEHAVVWTKPETFELDPERPMDGLGGHVQGRWHYARGDGSVTSAPMDFSAEDLKALITRNGGEVTRD